MFGSKRLWYLRDLERVCSVSYCTLRNHLLKLERAGFVVKSKGLFPSYYVVVDTSTVRLEVKNIFKKWLEVKDE